MSNYKIIFNCRALSSQTDGIGKYILKLASGLQNFKKYDTFFFDGKKCSKSLSVPQNKSSIKNFIRDYFPFSYETREILNTYFFNKENKKFKFHLYHEPSILPLYFNGPTIITVHDLSWILYPHLHPAKRTKFLTDVFSKKLKLASSIITDSDYVKKQIIDHFQISKTKIHTVYLGIDDEYKPRNLENVHKTLKHFNLIYDNFFYM